MSDRLQSLRLTDLLSQLDYMTNWEERPRGMMRVNVAPMADLMTRLGNPHKAFRSVHVAGTKGKSSTTALLEAAIGRAGISTGRYLSPHIDHIGERFCINGSPASDVEIAAAIDTSIAAYRQALAEGTDAKAATWFDLITAAAFLLFKRAGVRWAIIETGLGGRLDSTNIVDSEVQIITNVGLEHTEVLGQTRAQIALEKAGIIKSGSVVITPLPLDDEAGRVVADRAAYLGAKIMRPTAGSTTADTNHAVVLSALEALGALDTMIGPSLLDDIASKKARLAGRMEQRTAHARSGHLVPVVFDGAHVPFNLAAVLADLRQTYADKPCIAVVALAADKDASGFLDVLARSATEVIFTTAGVRSRTTAELLKTASEKSLTACGKNEPSDAFAEALNRAGTMEGWVLVTGSLYLTGALHRNSALKPEGSCTDEARSQEPFSGGGLFPEPAS